MKFTKTEIDLCKQVAEKHRKKIEYGDWYWSSAYPKILLAMDYGFKPNEQEFAGVFKIWTISDCLEFIFERGWSIEEFFKNAEDTFSFHINKGEEEYHFKVGKTPLEGCLKAVLAVLEEKSK